MGNCMFTVAVVAQGTVAAPPSVRFRVVVYNKDTKPVQGCIAVNRLGRCTVGNRFRARIRVVEARVC